MRKPSAFCGITKQISQLQFNENFRNDEICQMLKAPKVGTTCEENGSVGNLPRAGRASVNEEASSCE